MDGLRPPKRGVLTNLEDMGKLPKDRRDWLEIFGNQWGTRRFEMHESVMTSAEREALTDALNPFAGRAAAV